MMTTTLFETARSILLDDTNELEEGRVLTSIAAGLAILMAISRGVDWKPVTTALEAGNSITVVSKSPIIPDGGKKSTWIVKYDPGQVERITVDMTNNIIVVNTTDIGKFELKRLVRNSVNDIEARTIRRDLRAMRIQIDKK